MSNETITVHGIERHSDLCYCKPGFTGHVHAAKIDEETWARGVLAITELGRGSMATTTPRLSPCNKRAAERILARSSNISE